MSAGIAGYILKDAAASEVAAAVRSVVRKHAVWPGKLCFALLEYVSRQSLHIPIFRGEHRTGLSRREQQLLQRVSCGLTNKEVAAQLNLSEQTVKNHVHRIFRI